MMADASLQTGPKELDPASLGLAIRERRKAARMTQEVTASRAASPEDPDQD